MNFTIIIVTFKRQFSLWRCLESISSQNTQYNYEVIIVFNGNSDYYDSTRLKFPNFSYKLLKTAVNPSEARNIAIQEARGEFLFFLDDDCYLPRNYFTNISLDNSWDILGGPDQTPEGSTKLQEKFGLILASPLCMGPTYKRHIKTTSINQNADESELILCNLWFRASIFKFSKYTFNSELFRNEENFLLKQLSKENLKIVRDSNCSVFHERKSKLSEFIISFFKSGETRLDNFCKKPAKSDLKYFLPMILIIFHLLGFFSYKFFLTSLVFAIFYIILIFSYTIWIKRISSFFVLLLLHYLVLISYGIGMISRMIKLGLRNKT